MSDRSKKITELTAVTTVAANDVLVVVTNTATAAVTKKVTVNNFMNSLGVTTSFSQVNTISVGLSYNNTVSYNGNVVYSNSVVFNSGLVVNTGNVTATQANLTNLGVSANISTNNISSGNITTIATISNTLKLTSLNIYANNSEAAANSEAVGNVYKTATGELRIVV